MPTALSRKYPSGPWPNLGAGYADDECCIRCLTQPDTQVCRLQVGRRPL